MRNWTAAIVNPRPPILRPLLILGLGALVLAGGIMLALAWLPEWHSGLLSKEAYAQRYRDLAGRGGVRLTAGKPRVFLAAKDSDNDSDGRMEVEPDVQAAGPRRGGPPGQAGRRPADHGLPPGHPGRREVGAAVPDRSGSRGRAPGPELAPGRKGRSQRQQIDAMVHLLLAPGERLGERRSLKGESEVAYDLPGSDPPQRIDVKHREWRRREPSPADSSIAIRTRIAGTTPRPSSWP